MKILDAKEIGKIIKTFRKMSGLTQSQLAEIIEIDEKQLGKIERGVHYPSVPTFLKIIKILDIDIKNFYFEEYAQEFSNDNLIAMLKNSTLAEVSLVQRLFKAVKNI